VTNAGEGVCGTIIYNTYIYIVDMVPTLRIVMEHITTLEGVEFVTNAREGVCGTITVQHLMLNRNALFSHNGVVIFFLNSPTTVH
jgi:dihydroorotase